MDLLPSEIVNEIIKSTGKSILYPISYVCKQWRQLALQNVIKIKDRKDFVKICEQGDQLSIVRSKFNRDWIDDGLYGACRGGHKNLAGFMIAKGAIDWNYGLRGACIGGHRELVELMIAKGANDWNYGLHNACLGGHRELVELTITKGADNWNFGLYTACEKGHRELAELMIIKGADNWNFGLYNACSNHHKELIELMIAKGANNCPCGKSIIDH